MDKANPTPPPSPLIINYLTLRKILGVVGISFPVILVVGSVMIGGRAAIQPSISHYYYTNMGDVFVGFLCVMAIFLFAYNGYDYKDRIAGILAGIFALGVAFLPTDLGVVFSPSDSDLHKGSDNPLRSTLHFTSAALFLLTLAYFSIFLFTIKSANPTPQKIKRNRVYRACGIVIIACLVLLAVVFIFKMSTGLLKGCQPVFWLESIALFAFGTSWLVKGEALLKD